MGLGKKVCVGRYQAGQKLGIRQMEKNQRWKKHEI